MLVLLLVFVIRERDFFEKVFALLLETFIKSFFVVFLVLFVDLLHICFLRHFLCFYIFHEVCRGRLMSLGEIRGVLCTRCCLGSVLPTHIGIRRSPLLFLFLFLLLVSEVQNIISVVQSDIISVRTWLVRPLFLSQGFTLFAEVLNSPIVDILKFVSLELVLDCGRLSHLGWIVIFIRPFVFLQHVAFDVVRESEHVHLSVVLYLAKLSRKGVVSLRVELLGVYIPRLLQVHVELWLVREDSLGKFRFRPPKSMLLQLIPGDSLQGILLEEFGNEVVELLGEAFHYGRIVLHNRRYEFLQLLRVEWRFACCHFYDHATQSPEI